MQHSDLKPVGTKCYIWHGNSVLEAEIVETLPNNDFFVYTIEYNVYNEDLKKSFPTRDKTLKIFLTREEAEKALEEFNTWYIF